MVTDWGGKASEQDRMRGKEKVIKLPFNYCNISMTPAKDPYCTSDGLVFDLLNIIPHLKKH